MREVKGTMVCPLCNETVETVIYMNYGQPWVSGDPREGLIVYGPYSSHKGAFCEWIITGGKAWGVHLKETIILRDGYDGCIPLKETEADG